MLYIGGGIIHAGAADLLRRLAEKGSIPVTATLMGLGAMPSNHPLFLGMLGMHAARYTNMALDECDLLIAAGVRFDDRATGKVAQFCSHAKIIHVDIDASELGKIKMPFVGVQGDVRDVLAARFGGDAVDRPRGMVCSRLCELKATLCPLDARRRTIPNRRTAWFSTRRQRPNPTQWSPPTWASTRCGLRSLSRSAIRASC